MISALDPSARQFLNEVARVQTRSEQAQRQISSGLRVTMPSDAPEAITEILQLQASLRANAQKLQNMGRAKTEVAGAENALQSAAQLMDRASVLATEATGPMQDAHTRTQLAQEVQGLLEQMVSISGTSVDGRYIFSGDQDGSRAYTFDPAQQTGVQPPPAALSTTRQLEDASGGRFSIAKTATEIFDHRNADGSVASDNVFAALNGLRVALLNNDVAALTDSISNVEAAGKYLNLQLGFYGAAQTRVARATELSQAADTQLKTELSGQQDADLIAAILQVTQSQTQLQAALQSRAKLPHATLFDYLG